METGYRFDLPVERGVVKTREGKEEKCTHIKCELRYELGGINMFTGAKDKRGYYLHVSPVTRGDGFERFALFGGNKLLLKECQRKGKKAECVARAMFGKTVRKMLEQMYPEDWRALDFSLLPPDPEATPDREGVV